MRATVDSHGIAVMDGNLHMVVIGINYKLYHGWVDLVTDEFSGWSPLRGGARARLVKRQDGSIIFQPVKTAQPEPRAR